MIPPEYKKRIQDYIKTNWREGMRLCFQTPFQISVPITLEEALEHLDNDVPRFGFSKGQPLLFEDGKFKEWHFELLRERVERDKMEQELELFVRNEGSHDTSSWLIAAVLWVLVLDEPEKARNLLDEAQKRPLDHTEKSPTNIRKILFSDKEKVREILKRPGNFLGHADLEFGDTAEETRKRSLEESEDLKLKASLDRCETLADLLDSVEMWADIVTDRKKLDPFLEKAGEMAQETTDFLDLGCSWLEHCRNPVKGRRFLEKVELALMGDLSKDMPSMNDEELLQFLVTPLFEQLCHLAWAWLRYLNEEDRARELLVLAEEQAHSTDHFLDLTHSWYSWFPEEKKEAGLLEMAGELATDTTEFCRLASSVLWVLREEVKARELLEHGEELLLGQEDEAEKWVDSAGGYLSLAKSWQNLFGEEERSRVCFRKCAEIVRENGCWDEHWQAFQNIAKLWHELLDEEEEVKNFLSSAEKEESPTTKGLSIAAETWFGEFNDLKKAGELLLLAEGLAEEPGDLYDLARTWFVLLGNEEKSRELLIKAEEGATVYALGNFAATWLNFFGEEERALDTCRRLEEFAKTDESNVKRIWAYNTLAGLQVNLFKDREKARYYLTKAGELAELSEEFRDLARNWKELLDDEDKAKEQFARMEPLARKPKDLAELAKLWEELFEDKEGAQRLRELAKEKRHPFRYRLRKWLEKVAKSPEKK